MDQNSLLYKLNISYFAVGVISYLIIFFYWGNTFNYYNILNASVFLSYLYLLMTSIGMPETYYSNLRLGVTVLLYSFIFVSLYVAMSYTYTGNTLIFSDTDARIYEKTSRVLSEMPFSEMIPYLVHNGWNYDDWGAPLGMTIFLKIIPHKLFLNCCYILMGTVCSLLLFEIGKQIMSRQYAYLASLAYSISSYSIFYMGCMLKEEMMMTLVILSFYMLYKYRESKILLYLVGGVMVSLLVIFFRVPVAIFIWISYASWLLFGEKGHLKKGLFTILLIIASLATMTLIRYSTDRYANGGDVVNSYGMVTTTLFQKAVSTLGALVGPYPTLLQLSFYEPSYKPLYGAGLLYKLLLFFIFWKGAVYCFRAKISELYPLFVFVILEIAGLAISFDGLELRKAMPHMGLFMLAAFWFMYNFDEGANDEIRKTPYYYWTYKLFGASVCITLGMVIAWNTLIRIPHL